MAKNEKELRRQLEKCKDSTSSEARSIRRQLRSIGVYVSGKKNEVKKSKKNKKEEKKSKKSKNSDEDED